MAHNTSYITPGIQSFNFCDNRVVCAYCFSFARHKLIGTQVLTRPLGENATDLCTDNAYYLVPEKRVHEQLRAGKFADKQIYLLKLNKNVNKA